MKYSNRASTIYDERMKATEWPSDDMCDPPTTDKEFREIIINEFLGKDWYVAMPESKNQINTAALYDIIRIYIDDRKNGDGVILFIVGAIAFLGGLLIGCMI